MAALSRKAGVKPDLLFTSMLRRAIMTANLALDAMTVTGSPSSATGASANATTAAGQEQKEGNPRRVRRAVHALAPLFGVAPPAIEAGSEFSGRRSALRRTRSHERVPEG